MGKSMLQIPTKDDVSAASIDAIACKQHTSSTLYDVMEEILLATGASIHHMQSGLLGQQAHTRRFQEVLGRETSNWRCVVWSWSSAAKITEICPKLTLLPGLGRPRPERAPELGSLARS
jgi:hypothetical protein